MEEDKEKCWSFGNPISWLSRSLLRYILSNKRNCCHCSSANKTLGSPNKSGEPRMYSKKSDTMTTDGYGCNRNLKENPILKHINYVCIEIFVIAILAIGLLVGAFSLFLWEVSGGLMSWRHRGTLLAQSQWRNKSTRASFLFHHFPVTFNVVLTINPM